MFELVVLSWVVAVRWSVIFLEARVFFSLCKLALNHAGEVLLGEDTVLRDPVVHWCGLVVVKMLEIGSVGVTKKEWHECVAIVNSVYFLALEEAQHVVLDNRVLSHSGRVSSGGIETNSITKSKNVVVGLVLQSVLVYINTSSFVSEASVDQELMGLAGRVNAGRVEVLLNDCSSVYILENCNLSLLCVSLHFQHLPAEHHVDAALVTLFKSDLVGVGESVNFFVRSPVLNSSVVRSTAVQLILSHEVLVV